MISNVDSTIKSDTGAYQTEYKKSEGEILGKKHIPRSNENTLGISLKGMNERGLAISKGESLLTQDSQLTETSVEGIYCIFECYDYKRFTLKRCYKMYEANNQIS
jgi:hypothetical protein